MESEGEGAAREGKPIEYQKVGEVQVSKSGTVVVQTFTGSDGAERVDIRLFITGARYTGPTRKGVSIPIESVAKLIALLEQASEIKQHAHTAKA